MKKLAWENEWNTSSKEVISFEKTIDYILWREIKLIYLTKAEINANLLMIHLSKKEKIILYFKEFIFDMITTCENAIKKIKI